MKFKIKEKQTIPKSSGKFFIINHSIDNKQKLCMYYYVLLLLLLLLMHVWQ